MNINLIVGDWSHDGHGTTETVIVYANVDSRSLKNAFTKGSNDLLGFDFSEKCCDEYENDSIPPEVAQKLIDAGYETAFEEYKTGEKMNFDVDEFAHVWMFLAKIGNPEIEYVFIKNENINIGGYGLFEV